MNGLSCADISAYRRSLPAFFHQNVVAAGDRQKAILEILLEFAEAGRPPHGLVCDGKNDHQQVFRAVRQLIHNGEDMLFIPLALGDVDDGPDHQQAIAGTERIKADFDGEFDAVLAHPVKIAARPHRSRRGVLGECRALGWMPRTKPLRNQNLDAPPDQFSAGITEQLLDLLVREGDDAGLIDDDHAVRRRLEQQAQFGITVSIVEHRTPTRKDERIIISSVVLSRPKHGNVIEQTAPRFRLE